MSWDRLSTANLKRQAERLEWAALTTDDPLWREQHLRDRETCLAIISRRGTPPPADVPTRPGRDRREP